MSDAKSKTIYTIGHSTHPIEEFVEMLKSFEVKVLVDIRALPGSRKFPQFDQENLSTSLTETGIEYLYFAGLGGRRKVNKESKNTRWNNPSFRAYADYMETSEFKVAAAELEAIAQQRPTAYMCSEAVWWRCHRSMVSDYLKAKHWKVLHIMATGKVQEHPFTAPAIVKGEQVTYSDE
ncbi:MAG: DUF488 domain-containing protein [Flavobacterium sp.]|nr:MAG: DUF488 domain-containing protein [Flavobacterium sp.]